jgi:hypothetical protein
MLVFSTQLCELFPPLTFSLIHLPTPLPPSQSKRTVSVWPGVSCVGDHTLYLTRFRTYKIALPPQTQEGREPQTEKHLRKSPFTDQFFLDNSWHWHCLLSV